MDAVELKTPVKSGEAYDRSPAVVRSGSDEKALLTRVLRVRGW